MNRILAAIASASLLGGCAFMAPKPPPVIAEPPAGNSGGPANVDPKLQGSAPACPEIPGYWVSKCVTGPGSSCVRRVEMIFECGGTFTGTMLIEAEERKRFASLAGTWKNEDGKLAVTYGDGRARTWAVAWDNGVLVLKDGEGELRLERVPE